MNGAVQEVRFDTVSAARELAFHLKAIRSGLVSVQYREIYARRSVITWNAQRDAFVIESRNGRDSSWIASDIEQKLSVKVACVAQKYLPEHSTMVSQYVVRGETRPEAA